MPHTAGANFKFAIDSMYGSGARRACRKIFDAHGISYVAIRQEVNPLFPGINPEPILPHVALLQETGRERKVSRAAWSPTASADRIGAVAEDGSFVDSHKCMSRVLLHWLLVRKKWPGDVVRAFNTTGDDGSHRREIRAQAARDFDRLQAHCRSDDGAPKF